MITGGAGFIGSNIADEALAKGWDVIIFDNLIRPGVEFNLDRFKGNPKVTFHRGDVRNAMDFERLPKKPDVIIHMAGNPGIPWSINWPRYDFETNALGTLNVLEYARLNAKIPVIYASTNKVYSDHINALPLTETNTRLTPSDPSYPGNSEVFPIDSQGNYTSHSPYGCSKYVGDIYVQEYAEIYGLHTFVNRMSCIYGKWQHGVEDQGWTAWFVRAKIKGLPLNIYGNGKQVRDCLYGGDVAKLYMLEASQALASKLAGMRGICKVFNVGGGTKNTTSLLEAISYLDNHPKFKDLPKLKLNFLDWRQADHRYYVSDIFKVMEEMGWEPKVGVTEGLDNLIDWALEYRHIL